MASPPKVQITIVKGTTRNFPIPSCSLTADDLRRLYQILEKKVDEARDRQIAALQQLPEQTVAEFEQFKENVRSALKLVVRIQGRTGEWTAAMTVEALQDDSLPDTITGVVYDSAFLFRSRFSSEPQDSFSVTLDFTRTGILDLTNLYAEPAQNQSAALVSGLNSTWVDGVFDELRRFFNERTTSRDWLYSRYTYEFLVLFLGFPISFAFVYRMDRILRPTLVLPDALFVALYVYLVLVALLAFRLLFNYAKWIFPKIEGITRRQGGPRLHKTILGAIALVLLSLTITSLVRMIGIPGT